MQLHCVAHIIPLSSSAIPIFAFSPYLHSHRSLMVTAVSIDEDSVSSVEPCQIANTNTFCLARRVPGPLTLLLRWSGIAGEELLFNRMENRFLTKFAILKEIGEFLYPSI